MEVTVLGFEDVDPGSVGRCSWEVEQTRRDLEVLAWVGRFRFVTPRALSERFGVSWQQANARVRRLERLGFLGCERQHVSQPQAVFLTGRGHDLLGWDRRRAPRADIQREHEAAIVAFVVELELSGEDGVLRVLTERECRRLEARTDAEYSVEVSYSGPRKDRRRWPDAVVERSSGRTAIEFEFAPKGKDRLKRIVDGYSYSDPYDEVVFFVKRPTLGRTIARLVRKATDSSLFTYRGPAMVAKPWPGLDEDDRLRVAAALA
jgi:hypothetical protein